MGLVRSCSLTAVRAFLAPWLGRQEPAVRQQWRALCYDVTAPRGAFQGTLAVEPCCVPLLAWVGSPWGGHPSGPGPLCDDVGHALDRLGHQGGVVELCHLGGLAPGVVARAAPGAAGRAPHGAGAGLGRPGLVCALAVSAYHPAGMASICAHQYRRDCATHRPEAARAPADAWGPSQARRGRGRASPAQATSVRALRPCWPVGRQGRRLQGCA